MGRMKKTLLVCLVLFILSTSTVFAVEEENTVGVDKIINIAIEKNIDLELAGISLEDARLEYTKDKLNNLLSNSRLLELQSELQMVQAEENYKDIKEGVILEVISKYLEINKISQQIETAVKEVNLEEKRVEEVQAQVEVGYKSSLEFFEQETVHLSAINSLEKLKGDLEQGLRELRQMVSLDDKSKIMFLEFAKPEIWAVSEEKINSAAIASTVLDIMYRQVEVAKSDLEKAKISGTAELDIKKKELVLERVQLELEKEKQNLENDIKNTYFQYEQAVKNMNMVEKSLIQAEEHYKIISEQNEAGLISNNDLLSSELSLYKAKDEFISSISNYYITVLRLQQVMGLELEVSISNG